MSALSSIVAALGGVCLAVAMWQVIVTFSTDLEMQRFRAPDAPRGSFLLVPARWKTELYTDQGKSLVEKARHHQRLVYLFAVLGAGLLVISGAFG